MKKTVPAYGDTLSRGLNPINQTRHANEIRWPRVPEQQFEGSVEVVEAALCRCMNCFSDTTSIGVRDGSTRFPRVSGFGWPLDLGMIMLATNDVKTCVARKRVAASEGMERPAENVRSRSHPLQSEPSKIIFVSPLHAAETIHPLRSGLFNGTVAKSGKPASFSPDIADEMECAFFDAASVPLVSPLDGVH
ncbi:MULTISPECIES: hypothetical protein [Bartonella]|uniref:hypothetical protein n=1 Tax=Bartonella TaxID=773 RepID=UPI0018DBE26A|nr:MULTISPECIES: hypothetical protein [Bartonella]MBH9975224.1 hypothetical protein [Bartonella choladocola]MBI0014830.1 hypothetical protein [Bartonella sp. B10834G3]